MGEIEKIASTLQRQVPATQIVLDTDTLHHYALDGLVPRLVAVPTTVEELSQIVALANHHRLTVLARGGGSRINLGDLPEHIDVLVETTRINRLLEHEGPDLTCHVEAGMTLATLQTYLATRGQKLALDPPNAQQATIGGLLASNASGPKRLRYGTARDLVIGLRVVQSNGEISRSGGRVVKNVAGYDLNKLYIGSLGTLGVIVEANFKLHPLPAAERTLLLTYSNAQDAMQTVIAVVGSPLIPSALELIDAGASSNISEASSLNLPSNGYILAANFEGSAVSIERQLDEIRLLARKHHALMGNDLEGEEQQCFWEAVRAHTQGLLTCKVTLLVSHIASYLQHIDRICRLYKIEAATLAHAGNGILYIELRPHDATPRLVTAITELRTIAQEARGSLVVECCPVELKRQISIWGEPGRDFHMMKQIKQQFDPKGTFVRGRFLGGL